MNKTYTYYYENVILAPRPDCSLYSRTLSSWILRSATIIFSSINVVARASQRVGHRCGSKLTHINIIFTKPFGIIYGFKVDIYFCNRLQYGRGTRVFVVLLILYYVLYFNRFLLIFHKTKRKKRSKINCSFCTQCIRTCTRS